MLRNTKEEKMTATDEEKEMVKIFCEQNKKHLTDIWKLSDIPIFQNNPKAEYHLDKACYHLIMVQNCFWDQHFNYGRITREKRESELQEKNKSRSLLDTIKKMFMLWRWKE